MEPAAPFWEARGPQRWSSPAGDGHVAYHAALIRRWEGRGSAAQQGATAGSPPDAGWPLAFCFPGLGETAGDVVGWAAWTLVAPEPFLLVAPARPNNTWWFINDKSDYGWAKGALRPDLVELFGSWMEALATSPGVDSQRVGMFGFSAGAYAAAELLAQPAGARLAGVGLGGVHGHGQCDLSQLPLVYRQGAASKFEAFLDRLRSHRGAPWIEATHCPTDQACSWKDASEIVKALDAGQERLGLPPVSFRDLAPDQHDSAPSKKRNRAHHNYFRASFLREDFLVALLGGPVPPPGAPTAPPAGGERWLPRAGAPGGHQELATKSWRWLPRAETAAGAPGAACAGGEGTQFMWDAGNGGGKKRKWRPYPPAVHERIVEVFNERGGTGSLVVDIEGWQYTINFDNMEQVAHHTQFKRKIQRVGDG